MRLSDVYKVYEHPRQPVSVLAGVSLALDPGDSLAVTGPSGSGKSTLLHIIGTLDTPTSGRVEIEGDDPFALPEPRLARFRNDVIGFVFQDHHLLPQYSVFENVLLPTRAHPRPNQTERARDLLEKVGLTHRLDHRPAELSGGERQRVAIARALINQPRLLLCDEPTGNLDQATADTVADLLFELHQAERNLLIMVTHSLALAKRCAAHSALRQGKLADPA